MKDALINKNTLQKCVIHSYFPSRLSLCFWQRGIALFHFAFSFLLDFCGWRERVRVEWMKNKMTEIRIIAKVHATHSKALNNARDGRPYKNASIFRVSDEPWIGAREEIGLLVTASAYGSSIFLSFCVGFACIHTSPLTKMNGLKIYHICSILQMAVSSLSQRIGRHVVRHADHISKSRHSHLSHSDSQRHASIHKHHPHLHITQQTLNYSIDKTLITFYA